MARGQKLVPQSKQALDILKYEIAAELGLPIGGSNQTYTTADTEFAGELGTLGATVREEYWGNISSRDAGAVGGTITKRLIQKAEETLFSIPTV